MAYPVLVTGHAGTGKTTRVMGLVGERVAASTILDHQRILGMSFMHGARRRLDQKLAEVCGAGCGYNATTIDSFSLSIINRWRTAFGFTKPVSPKLGVGGVTEDLFEMRASFEWIRSETAKLLSSQTVGRVIGASFPLIVVDEFQDCQGPQLELIKALSHHSQLLLAADEFQLLNAGDFSCSAVEWVLDLERNGKAIIEDLTTPHRTTNPNLLQAARCLRENHASTSSTVPLICCPKSPAAAWWIIQQIALSRFLWKGSCAVISPSLDSFVKQTLESCNTQLRKKNLRPITFHREASQEQELKQLALSLGISEGAKKDWSGDVSSASPLGLHIIDRAQRYCRLRGMTGVPERLVLDLAELTISSQRAFGHRTASRIASTIHGTKNREFENVFVLWNRHTVSRWSSEEQRRLLYNGITRARRNCMVLVLGSEAAANSDPVLRLLGPARAAFAKKTTSTKTKRAKKSSK